MPAGYNENVPAKIIFMTHNSKITTTNKKVVMCERNNNKLAVKLN